MKRLQTGCFWVTDPDNHYEQGLPGPEAPAKPNGKDGTSYHEIWKCSIEQVFFIIWRYLRKQNLGGRKYLGVLLATSHLAHPPPGPRRLVVFSSFVFTHILLREKLLSVGERTGIAGGFEREV